MICIRPIAPARLTARGSPALSACMTARIQCSAMPKRTAASATNVSNAVARTADG
jgi:hypothetical protein